MSSTFQIETKRFILRELRQSDAKAFFEMDRNPNVHRYLNNQPLTQLAEAKKIIAFIQAQYEDYGIGRWAIIDKETDDFIGWVGLKYITEPINHQKGFYDIGYRLNENFWGLGIATETAAASLKYAFEVLGLEKVVGTCDVDNIASKKILEKIGLRLASQFEYQHKQQCYWLEISKEEWMKFKH